MLTEQEYKTIIERILVLMNKGEGNLTPKEIEELVSLSEQAEKYEEIHYPILKPNK